MLKKMLKDISRKLKNILEYTGNMLEINYQYF